MWGTLPFFSQLLLAFGSFVGKHGFFLFSAFILGVGSAAWALSRAQVRSALNQRLWRLPAIGERMKTYQLARLYPTAGMPVRAGTPASARARTGEGPPPAPPPARPPPAA